MNLDKFFKPEKVAIIGVSESENNLARNIVANLGEFAFDGIVYAVGHKGGHVFGKRIYESVTDVPDDIDLALILTPADTIPGILEECGKKGIRHAVIESAGFREYGDAGREREKRLLSVTKKYGIRFIGPNCIGLMDTHKGLILPFLQLKNIYRKGNISIVTQSGGVGITFLNIFAGEQLGIAKFASIGNKLDIDENDVLEYYLSDDETEVVVVYIEGISDGRRLMRAAMNSNKPVLVYKANTGTLGKTIAASHTGALSSDDAVVDAALRQAGIARFRDRTTMVDYLKVIPLPKIKGNNLAILSRSGGYAILAADAAEANGFALAPFKKSILKKIEAHFRASVIKLTNPLDLGDVFDYDLYLKIIDITARQKDVHGIVFFHACFTDAEMAPTKRLVTEAYNLSKKYDKPILICIEMYAGELYKLRKELEPPIFSSPRETIRSLALDRDFHYEIHRKAALPSFSADKGRVKKILSRCRREKRPPLLQEGLEIFSCYSIPAIKSACAKTADDAVKAAGKFGYPIVLKIESREISHKSDVGGVELNLKNASQVRETYDEMLKRVRKKMPGAAIDGVVVQPMVRRSPEMILGAKNDPNFGPVVLAGLGGIFVEIMKDIAMRVVPFSEKEALKMLKELRGYPILTGARGGRMYDINAVVKSIMRLSRLIHDFPEIKEIDINPFYVMHKGEGGMALDARVVLAAD